MTSTLRAEEPSHHICNPGTGKGITALGPVACFEKAVGVKVQHRIIGARQGDLGLSVAAPAR